MNADQRLPLQRMSGVGAKRGDTLVWSGTQWAPGSSGLAIVSPTSPPSPAAGQMWLDNSSGGGTGIWDDFNRANNTSSLGTSGSGHTWVALAGTWGISSNQAHLYSGTQNYAVIDTALADCTVGLDIAVASSNGGGLTWRAVDVSNLWFWDVDSSGSGGAAGSSVYKIVAGTLTQVATGLVGFDGGSSHQMSVVLSGSSMTLQKDGVTVTTITDSTHSTATKHGLREYVGSLTLIDNFSINGAGPGMPLYVWDGTNWRLIAMTTV